MSDAAITATLGAKDVGMSKLMEKVAGLAGKAGASFKKMEHQGKESFEHMKEGIHKFGEEFGGAFKFGGAAGLGAMGAEKLAEGIKDISNALPEFAEKAEGIANSAKKTGMGVEAYQELAYAMKMVGVPAETMEKAFKKLNVGMAQLHKHQGPLLEGLKRLNPELMHEIMGAKTADDAFMLTAEAISKETDATKRAAIATAVFGKAGVEMLPALLKGKEGLEELRKEADKYGGVMSEDMVTAGEKLNESLKHINGSITGMTNLLLADIATAIEPMIKSFGDFLSQNKGVVKVLEAVGVAALALVGIFAVVKGAAMGWAVMSALIETLSIAMLAFDGTATLVEATMTALNIIFAANPIGLIVVAVAALAAGAYLLWQNWSTLGPIFEKVGGTIMKFILTPINLLIDGIIMLLDVASHLPGIGDGFKSAADAMRGTKDAMNQALTGSKGTFDYGGVWDNHNANQKAASEHGGYQYGAGMQVTSAAPVVHVTNYIDGVKQEPSRTEVKTASKSMGRGAAPVARPDPNSQAHF